MATPKQKQSLKEGYGYPGYGMPPEILEAFQAMGYLHETQVQVATSTTPRSRSSKRWKGPKPVRFGNEEWYPVSAIKAYLDSEARALEELGELV